MTTIPLPNRMRMLPVDKHGRPIPWFVHINDDGVPDFRVIRSHGIEDAYRFGYCWVCGEPRGKFAAFVLGPMCAINRTTSEPPCHRDCAEYAARACPFLATPAMTRRTRDMPDAPAPGIMGGTAGIALDRNPGVALVWITRDWSPFRAPGGVLFRLGEPTHTAFYAHGRNATVEEIRESIRTGLPFLRAAADVDGERGHQHLDRQLADTAAAGLFPPGVLTP